MTRRVQAIVGTDKGAFLLRSDDSRSDWEIEGPLFKGWKVTASLRDQRGRFIVATASDVYGAAIHVSDDLKEWRQIENGPAWPKASSSNGGAGSAAGSGDSEGHSGGDSGSEDGRKLNQIWTIVSAGDRLYAGVDVAGLFASDDGGESWSPVDGLNEHETRAAWYPGAGGLCAHVILVDPHRPERVWCGISAVGVFRTDDGGATWQTKNDGIPVVIEDKTHKDVGRCVHGLVADPDDPDRIYRREHIGMFRSSDGGDSWERIENGLSSWFGFPIVMDRPTKTIFVIPLESDEYRLPPGGSLQVYRSRDGGDSWESASAGLPDRNAYTGVLRGAMDTDGFGGVYFGTTSGTIHVSTNHGDSWTTLPAMLPRILSVRVFPDA